MKKFLKTLVGVGTGGTSILWKIIVDAVLALVGRIGWKIIVERAVTRSALALLDWLASMSTNQLTKEFVQDIRDELTGVGLPKAQDKTKLTDLGKTDIKG